MLTVRLAVILLLSIVLTRTKEISATSCKNVVFGAGTEYDQVESCCLIGKHSYYSLDRAVGSTVVFSQVSGDVYVNNSVFILLTTLNTEVTVQQFSIHLKVQLLPKQS